MRESTDLQRRDLRALLALVDGSLPAAERPAVEARLRGSPEGRRALVAHRRTTSALRGSGPSPPAELRRRVEARAREAPRRRRTTHARVALAGGLAALVLGVGAALSGVLGGQPSAADAAALTALPATQPTPPQLAARPELLARDVEGVRFPAWGEKFGWHPHGARADELDGRRTVTVFYEHQDHRVGYTIVSGPPLEPPEGAKRSRVRGVELASWRDGMRSVVMFERDGHTCVIAGHVIHADTLPKLATWRGDGPVKF